eukprot:350916-Chlamydomonas_euryale.AAC.3
MVLLDPIASDTAARMMAAESAPRPRPQPPRRSMIAHARDPNAPDNCMRQLQRDASAVHLRPPCCLLPAGAGRVRVPRH